MMIRLLLLVSICFLSLRTFSQCSNPGAFTLSTPSASAIKSAVVTLSWSTSSLATEYEVYYKRSSASTFTKGPTVTTTGASVSGLVPEAQYNFKIISSYFCDDVAEPMDKKRESNTITITMDPLAIPSNLGNLDITQTSFTADWDVVEGATSYAIKVFNGAVEIHSSTTTTNQKSVTGLTPGNTYSWQVKSRGDGSTESNFSAGKTVLMKPATPSGLSTSEHTTTSFKAAWNDVSGETGYELEVATSSGFSAGTFVSGFNPSNVTGTSKIVTGLNAGTTYYFRVRSKNASGSSTNPTGVNTITEPLAPVATAPGTLTQTSFIAKWNTVTGASGYQLDVSADNFTTLLDAYSNKTVSGTTHTVEGLLPGILYKYRLRAVNANGLASTSSDGIEALTLPPDPVSAAATAITENSFIANWSATGSPGYRLDVSNDDFATLLDDYGDLPVTGTSQTVTGLAPGTVYQYRVRSANGSGVSGYSDVITITTIPAPPAADDADGITQSSFTAKWNPVQGADNYRLDVSVDNFSSLLDTYNGKEVSGNSQSVEGLASGTSYQYRVRAANESGASQNSEFVTVITIPGNPITEASTGHTQTSFVARWSPRQNATEYLLDVSADDFNTMLPDFNGREVEGTAETVDGLTPGTIYKYRVKAKNESGASGYSDIAATITVPSTPAGLAALNTSQSGFTAAWDPATGADNYRLDVSADDFNTMLSGYNNLEVQGTAQEVSGLSSGTYKFRVRAANGSGISRSSSSLDVPLVPGNPVTTTPGDITQTSFTANWNAMPDAISYRLDVSADNFATLLADFNNREVSTTSLSVTGLEPGKSYQYRIRSVNESGLSENSNITNVLLKPSNPVAHEVIKQNLEHINQHFFKAVWTPVLSATAYHIDVSLTDDFSNFITGYENKSVDGAVSELKVEGLSAGTIYFLRLRSANASGVSGNSNTVEVITLPGTPDLHQPSAITQNDFNVSWDEVKGAEHYFIDVATTNTFANFVAGFQNTLVQGTAVEVTGLSAGAKYFIRVRSANTSGLSSHAPVVEQITVPAAMLPQNITEREKTNNQIVITWTNVTGASFYEVQVAADELFNTPLENYNPREVDALTELAITGLASQSAYFVRIKSGNNAGISEYSGVKTITTTGENGSGGEDTVLKIDVPVFNTIFNSGDAINVNISGGIGSKTVIFHYRPVMEQDYIATSLASETAEYNVSIDPTWLDELGMEFYFSVTDGSGQVAVSPVRFVRPKIENAILPVATFGGTLKDYRIISLPYEVEEDAIERILEPALGSYNKGKWRLVRYQDGKNVDYSEGLSKTKMERGNGYWFNSLNEVAIQLLSAAVPGNDQNTPFQLNLKAGWNQIGNPYPFPIDWQEVMEYNGTPETIGNLLIYDAETISFKEATTLNSFEGGFIYSDNPVTISIPVTVKSVTANGRKGKDSSVSKRQQTEGWFIPVTLSQGGMVNELNGFGMHSLANTGKDKFDAPVVPRFVRYLEWKSENNDSPVRLARDVVDMKDEYTWLFETDHNANEEVSLRWNTPEGIDGSVILHDLNDNMIIDMKQANEYVIRGGPRSFRVAYSRDPLVVANETKLGTAYPNPATERVSILTAFNAGNQQSSGKLIVYDLSGNHVVTLTKSFHQKGLQSILWDLRSQDRQRVSSGMYFYELTTDEQNNTLRFRGRIVVK